MSDVTLTEFLLARIDEDEATAREALEFTQHYVKHYGSDVRRWRWACAAGGSSSIQQVSHDPARVLAECEAKRRIVQRWIAMVEKFDERGRPAHLFDPVLSMLVKSHEYELRDLAAIGDDHPDYREEWRP